LSMNVNCANQDKKKRHLTERQLNFAALKLKNVCEH
jgi:hypothetical protein